MRHLEEKTMLVDNLPVLNSLTKYPSIPTYHDLGDKGMLQEAHLEVPDSGLIYTEKVDGTNVRIVAVPGEPFLIGSREEFLHALGDICFNPTLGIVEDVRHIASQLSESYAEYIGPEHMLVLFGELYGGKIGQHAKQYTSSRENTRFRLFDAIEMPIFEAEKILGTPREKIALWRENGGQPFVDDTRLGDLADILELDLTPRISLPSNVSVLPESVETGESWIASILPQTLCALDDSGQGKAEGIVVRALDRSFIAKIRYEDYTRTMKRRIKIAT